MTTGLVIGKFMPVHAGHQHLIDFARARVSRLELILFTKPAEPIPGPLRAAWLRELYPAVAVHHIDQDGPVDYDSGQAWEFWIQAIRKAVPVGPDLVFSSEPYGDELARRLGARHVLVDADRARVPVSATQVRENPLAHWGFLPAPVRAYYARRVCVLGAESTGKTTLAAALAGHFGTVWVPEFARAYLLANGNVVERADMLQIARGQAASEERLAREANRLLVTDTNLLTTHIWHEHYFGDCPDEIRRLADERTAHLYLVCGPEVPWVPDELRDSPGHRAQFHERFCTELTKRGLPFVVLAGSHTKRLAQAVAVVERLLSAAPVSQLPARIQSKAS